MKEISSVWDIRTTEKPEEDARIRRELRMYLPGYMISDQIEFVNDLPKNPNGKVDRKELELRV